VTRASAQAALRRNDLELYERHAAAWWDPAARPFRSLQTAKRHHRDQLAAHWGGAIDGAVWVDLGCGGGLLSVPFLPRLLRLVLVDRSAASLDAARRQCVLTAPDRAVDTRATDLRGSGLPAGSADLVTLSDVVEHLDDPRAAIAEAARLLRPGGRLYVNTINRTRRARLLAVTLAEGLGLVPRGTHDPALFVRPADLLAMAGAVGLSCERLQGEAPRWLRTLRDWAIHLRAARSTAVSYGAFFRRAEA
jgi:2-polyprenyl-6-hydroxyphenyl methylase/3-demethylubiquinone-9 3-methyltransferase